MHPLYGRSRLLDTDERLTIIREGDAVVAERVEYRDGKPVKRTPQTFVTAATVQPAGARELLLVPEGDRHRGVMTLWQPKGAETPTLQTGDKVLRPPGVWQVQAADDWGSFVQARMVRIDTADADQYLGLEAAL